MNFTLGKKQVSVAILCLKQAQVCLLGGNPAENMTFGVTSIGFPIAYGGEPQQFGKANHEHSKIVQTHFWWNCRCLTHLVYHLGLRYLRENPPETLYNTKGFPPGLRYRSSRNHKVDIHGTCAIQQQGVELTVQMGWVRWDRPSPWTPKWHHISLVQPPGHGTNFKQQKKPTRRLSASDTTWFNMI